MSLVSKLIETVLYYCFRIRISLYTSINISQEELKVVGKTKVLIFVYKCITMCY